MTLNCLSESRHYDNYVDCIFLNFGRSYGMNVPSLVTLHRSTVNSFSIEVGKGSDFVVR